MIKQPLAFPPTNWGYLEGLSIVLDNASSAFVSDLGAGKHPSTIDWLTNNQKERLIHNKKVAFDRIKKYCSYPKLSHFSCDSLPAPLQA